MINAFHTAVSGALSYQDMLDIESNNLANVNTTGYKPGQAGFADILYTDIAGVNGGQNLQIGNGVKLSTVDSTLTQGSMNNTGRVLDAAIEGEGYFCTSDANGELHYTRDGNFSISDGYLVSSDGERVLDQNQDSIAIPEDQSNLLISGSNNSTGETQNMISPGVFTFTNPNALDRLGNNKLKETSLSGQGIPVANAKLKQGYLESSSVDLASEMAKLISAQRGFQMNAKMIQTADEIERISNTLQD